MESGEEIEMERVSKSSSRTQQNSPSHETKDETKAQNPRKGGGWKTMPYIIGNETFEKLASMSLIANMVVYLRTQYNMDGLVSVTVFNIWTGTANFAPLFGAFLSDGFLGKFWTLLFGSFCTLLGMVIMALTAAIPNLRPPACQQGIQCERATKWQLSVLFLGLGLLTLGAGGIRPCNIAFGVDQFDITTEKGRKQAETFYNWYYWNFTIALLFALTVVVYVQNSVSWVWGLAIPAACIALSIVVFLLGRHIYVYVKPQGSVFVDLAKVIVAAYRKRHLKTGLSCQYSLYDPPSKESVPAVPKLPHTNRFTCLDKAALITNMDVLDNQGLPRNGWRLCSIEQVERLKCLVSLVPVWVSGIACLIVIDQQTTFGVLQAIQMNRRFIGQFHVPPGSMGVTSMLALSVWIPIYMHIIFPLSKKITKKGITLRHRMIAGILVSIICMLTAGIIEGRRRALALKHQAFIAPMSFAWLLPQFILSGLTEALSCIAIMEFFNTQLPQSMRTIASSLFFLSIAIASYLSSFVINIVHKVSGKDGKPAWLGGLDLNRNKLDYYYYCTAALGGLNCIYFTLFASRYVDSGVAGEGNGDEDGSIDTEKK